MRDVFSDIDYGRTYYLLVRTYLTNIEGTGQVNRCAELSRLLTET